MSPQVNPTLLLTTEGSMAANTSDLLTALKAGQDDIKTGEMTSLSGPMTDQEAHLRVTRVDMKLPRRELNEAAARTSSSQSPGM